MAKTNRPEPDPRADRHEDAQHMGDARQHQASGGMSAHSTNHADPEHEHSATATMPRKQQQPGSASPTAMKSKKSNQPRRNQPKR
jgi:hypothetical protein